MNLNIQYLVKKGLLHCSKPFLCLYSTRYSPEVKRYFVVQYFANRHGKITFNSPIATPLVTHYEVIASVANNNDSMTTNNLLVWFRSVIAVFHPESRLKRFLYHKTKYNRLAYYTACLTTLCLHILNNKQVSCFQVLLDSISSEGFCVNLLTSSVHSSRYMHLVFSSSSFRS